jgi:hypothetical protein
VLVAGFQVPETLSNPRNPPPLNQITKAHPTPERFYFLLLGLTILAAISPHEAVKFGSLHSQTCANSVACPSRPT